MTSLMKASLFILFFALLFITGCKEDRQPRKHVSKAELIEYNKKLVQRDSAFITHYCNAQGLDSLPDRRGLWITIHEEGNGDMIKEKEMVDLAYRISDILGKEYYNSERDGIKHLTVGSGQDIMALDIALPQLKHGSKATLIVMPDLAYGLIGDENKIGARRILRYDIEVIN